MAEQDPYFREIPANDVRRQLMENQQMPRSVSADPGADARRGFSNTARRNTLRQLQNVSGDGFTERPRPTSTQQPFDGDGFTERGSSRSQTVDPGAQARDNFTNAARGTETPSNQRSLRGTLKSGAKRVLNNPVTRTAGRVLRAPFTPTGAALTAASVGLPLLYNAFSGEDEAVTSTDNIPRDGNAFGDPLPAGLPTPNANEAANPNLQTVDLGGGNGGYVVPTGPGAGNPFGRTPEVQAQIDRNVAAINAETEGMRENRNLRRELSGGRALGTNGEGSPEQQQIRRLASQMRSGSIGDRQRNNVLQQQIDALQGVDTANVSRENTQAVMSAALLKEQGDMSRSQMEAQQEKLRYLNEALADPEQSQQVMTYLAQRQSTGVLDPSERVVMNTMLNQSQNSRGLANITDPVFEFFGRSDRVDTTDPSTAGNRRVSGGGGLGSLLGYGPATVTPDGVIIRDNEIPAELRDIYLEAQRRDNPGR